MATKFIEPVLDRMLFILRRDLAAKLDEIDAELGKATLVSPEAETYNITTGTNTLNLSVDGSAKTVTLTTGAARTAQQVATDINNAGIGADASVYTPEDSSGNHVKIESQTVGDGSLLEVLDGTANAVFGFYQGERNAGFALRDPVAWFVGGAEVISQFPAIEAFELESTAGEATTNTIEAVHRIAVAVTEVDADLETIKRKTFRYLRAITEVILADAQLLDYVDHTDFVGHDYDFQGRSEELGYGMSGAVILDVRLEETLR